MANLYDDDTVCNRFYTLQFSLWSCPESELVQASPPKWTPCLSGRMWAYTWGTNLFSKFSITRSQNQKMYWQTSTVLPLVSFLSLNVSLSFTPFLVLLLSVSCSVLTSVIIAVNGCGLTPTSARALKRQGWWFLCMLPPTTHSAVETVVTVCFVFPFTSLLPHSHTIKYNSSPVLLSLTYFGMISKLNKLLLFTS